MAAGLDPRRVGSTMRRRRAEVSPLSAVSLAPIRLKFDRGDSEQRSSGVTRIDIPVRDDVWR